MAYSTLADIKKAVPEEVLVQLTDDEGFGDVDQGRVDEAIASADEEINSYCGERYSVPFTTVPGIVKKISVDIAVYNLYSRKVEEAPDIRKERYKSAIRQLEGIAKGTISLGVDPAPSAPSEGGPETNKTDDDRIFTRDKLKGF